MENANERSTWRRLMRDQFATYSIECARTIILTRKPFKYGLVTVTGIVTTGTIRDSENFSMTIPEDRLVKNFLDCISAQLTKFPPL
jgi:hypothetical protein